MSRSLRRIALFPAALLAVPLLAAPAYAANGTVTGTVTGPGGTPLSGIPVRLYSVLHDDGDPQQLLAHTSTDGAGHYAVDLAAGTEAIVCFESPDFVAECWDDRAQQQPGSVAAARYGTPVTATEAGTTGVNAALVVGGSLAGQLQLSTGGPGRDVLVIAQARIGEETFTSTDRADSNGDYLLEHLVPGAYTVCTSSPVLVAVCADAVTVGETGTTQVPDLELVTRPTGLRVSLVGEYRLRWTWNAVPGATYEVRVSRRKDFASSVVRYVSTPWATFAGLHRFTRYYAKVRAVSATSRTQPSATSTLVTGHLPYVRATAVSTDSLSLTWATYVPASGYRVRISSKPASSAYRTLRTTGTTGTFGNLEPGTTYFVTYAALDRDGRAFRYSRVLRVTTAD